MPSSFFDTNVLVYLTSKDAAKADRAEACLATGGTVSVQVLNEFANVARRKMRFSWLETRAFLAVLRSALAVEPVTLGTHDSGLSLAERYGFSVWDAMIVASAVQSGCDTLWSEDLQHGMVVEERLQILNPFREASAWSTNV